MLIFLFWKPTYANGFSFASCYSSSFILKEKSLFEMLLGCQVREPASQPQSANSTLGFQRASERAMMPYAWDFGFPAPFGLLEDLRFEMETSNC